MIRYTLRLGAATAFACLASLGSVHAGQQFTVLYTFQGGSDGRYPSSNLVKDEAGNLYGTTTYGGGGTGEECYLGCGTVFKLAPDGTETVLYAFTGGSDGALPDGGVTLDGRGNLYGAAPEGGYFGSNCPGPFAQYSGCGTFFELAPSGAFNLLHTFAETAGNTDGITPSAGPLRSGPSIKASHYGFTEWGGSNCTNNQGPIGCGTTYKIAPNGTETVLYSFLGGASFGNTDGWEPNGSPVADPAGNLYGTTSLGGSSAYCGTIFKLAPDGTETVLYSFTCGSDGGRPEAGLVRDKAGNLYGTASQGGLGWGTVFKLAPDGTFTVLYSFADGADGAGPTGSLVLGARGDIYGTAGGGTYGYGVVFELNSNGVEVVLHAFSGGADGWGPSGSLLRLSGGNLIGTASMGGNTTSSSCYDSLGCGTIFEVKEFP